MTPEEELQRLRTQGYVILEDVLSREAIDVVLRALAPFEAARPLGRNDFEGLLSTRVYSLAAKGEAFLRLAEHPRILRILDATLLPNFLLSTYQSIRLHPGENAQAWHTDDAFYLVNRPRGTLGISTIWAITDFTEDNGATEVIAGSHRWGMEHPDEVPHEVHRAVMRAGSVLVFDAALWHRGGANASQGTRLALSPQFCQPWLRPQESQLLIVPPDCARACSD